MRKSELRAITKEIILNEIAFPDPTQDNATQREVMDALKQKFPNSPTQYYCNLVAWQYGQIIAGNEAIKMHPRDVIALAAVFYRAIKQNVPDNELARIFTRNFGIRDIAKNLIASKHDIAHNPDVLLSLNKGGSS